MLTKGVHPVCLSNGAVSAAVGELLGPISGAVRLEWGAQLYASHYAGVVLQGTGRVRPTAFESLERVDDPAGGTH